MKSEILKYVICSLLGAIITAGATALKTYVKKIKENAEKREDTDQYLIEAVRVLLREQIKLNCKYYIQAETITHSEYKELYEAIKIYESEPFNGNGLVHKLWKQVESLDITP